MPNTTEFYNWTKVNTNGRICLRPYQLKMFEPIVNAIINQTGEEFCIMFPRQSGKTTFMSNLIHYLTLTLPTDYKKFQEEFIVGLFGPSKEQIAVIFHDLKRNYDTEFTTDIIGIKSDISNGENFQLTNNAAVRARTASLTAKIEGRTINVAFMDEAQDIPYLRIMKSIHPMCAHTRGPKIMIGTLTPETERRKHENYFENCLKKFDDAHKFIIHEQDVIPYDENWHQEFLRAKKELGSQHPIFLTQWCGKFVEVSDSFMTGTILTKNRSGSIKQTELSDDCFVGIDVGKMVDPTVVTIIDSTGIINWFWIRGAPYTEQCDLIDKFLKRFNIKRGYMDCQGPGEVFRDMLHQKGWTQIDKLGTNAAIKSKMYLELEIAILQGNLKYPDNDVEERHMFEHEMTNLQREYLGNQMRVSKSKNRGAHDDYCDSCALAWYSKVLYEPTNFSGTGSLRGGEVNA